MARGSFREQVLRVREEAIVSAAIRRLAAKGFDLMTVDEVAADVGVAKASVYKHFASKEALAAAAMLRVLQQASGVAEAQAAELAAADKLEAVARWALQRQLAGEMPALPPPGSPLRAELHANPAFQEALARLGEHLRGWIERAQADGALDPALPAELVLYALVARAVDPVPGFLQAVEGWDDARIVDGVLRSCFAGLRAR